MTNQADIVTFGCRLNAYESEVMRDLARDAGLTDTVIVNTCAVTAEAERQARQAIRRARREQPDARIIVTGCAAQIAPDKFASMPEVDTVLGNIEKLDPRSYGKDVPRITVDDIMSVRDTAGHLIEGFDGRARAFVQVQQGCDHRCTFCIIPYGRGPSRSVPMGVIARQVRRLVETGYREIVLTGVDMTSYGADLPGEPRLGQMVRRLLAAVPELPRLRLSSIDSVEVDADLIAVIADEERFMPHLHLSFQAGDDLILKRMKRRHLRSDAIAFCHKIRKLRPDIAFGADLIAGFPTESEAMFQRSLDLVEECGLTWLHVFPFSARVGTPAARMPQVPGDVRRERAARLRALGGRKVEEFHQAQIGRQSRVLVERNGIGHTEQFAAVTVADPVDDGAIVSTTITGVDSGRLIGRVAA